MKEMPQYITNKIIQIYEAHEKIFKLSKEIHEFLENKGLDLNEDLEDKKGNNWLVMLINGGVIDNQDLQKCISEINKAYSKKAIK